MSALFRLEEAMVRYAGREVLRVPGLEIAEGAVLGLAGHNGSGKSTLLRLLALLERPSQGRLLVDGRPVAGRELELRRSITLLDQEPYLLRRSVFENVAYGLRVRGDRRDLSQRVAEALTAVGLDPDFGRRSWRELSGGEAQRVALAARLALRPRVLLLDEPTASLDAESVARINEAALKAREQWGTTLVLVSHDLSWLFELAPVVLHLHHGRVAGYGRVNVLRGPWLPGPDGAALDLGESGRILAPAAPAPDAPAAIDPAEVRLLDPGAADAANALRAVVREIHAAQNGPLVLCQAGFLRLWARPDPQRLPAPGSAVLLGLRREAVRFLDQAAPRS